MTRHIHLASVAAIVVLASGVRAQTGVPEIPYHRNESEVFVGELANWRVQKLILSWPAAGPR